MDNLNCIDTSINPKKIMPHKAALFETKKQLIEP